MTDRQKSALPKVLVCAGLTMCAVGALSLVPWPVPGASVVAVVSGAESAPMDVRIRLENPTLRPVSAAVSGGCCSLDGSSYVRLAPLSSQEVTAKVDLSATRTRGGSPMVGVAFAGGGIDRKVALRLPHGTEARK